MFVFLVQERKRCRFSCYRQYNRLFVFIVVYVCVCMNVYSCGVCVHMCVLGFQHVPTASFESRVSCGVQVLDFLLTVDQTVAY